MHVDTETASDKKISKKNVHGCTDIAHRVQLDTAILCTRYSSYVPVCFLRHRSGRCAACTIRDPFTCIKHCARSLKENIGVTLVHWFSWVGDDSTAATLVVVLAVIVQVAPCSDGKAQGSVEHTHTLSVTPVRIQHWGGVHVELMSSSSQYVLRKLLCTHALSATSLHVQHWGCVYVELMRLSSQDVLRKLLRMAEL